MRIERFDDPVPFFARVGDFLGRAEALHSLILGFREPLERNLHYYGDEDPYLAAVLEGDEVVTVAARTPPHNLVLSRATDPAIDALVDALAAAGAELPGVGGPSAGSDRFASRWAAATGVTARLTFAELLYEATEVSPPRDVGGRMRPCREDDRPTAVAWMEAFFAEAMPAGSPGTDAEAFVTRRLAEPGEGLVIWDDGGAASLAGYAGPTPTGIRVGPSTPRPSCAAAATRAPSPPSSPLICSRAGDGRASSPPTPPTRPPTRSIDESATASAAMSAGGRSTVPEPAEEQGRGAQRAGRGERGARS